MTPVVASAALRVLARREARRWAAGVDAIGVDPDAARETGGVDRSTEACAGRGVVPPPDCETATVTAASTAITHAAATHRARDLLGGRCLRPAISSSGGLKLRDGVWADARD